MIPLRLKVQAEGEEPYVVLVGDPKADSGRCDDSGIVIDEDDVGVALVSRHGLASIDGIRQVDLAGDVLLIDPRAGSAERLIRATSHHNTLLVTERCDQLCQMCSQPPKKTHHDRFALLERACLLAPQDIVIGITGGEPTLYKQDLLAMLERVLEQRPDLAFHVLSNGQHFVAEDVPRLRNPIYQCVQWGIPIYAASTALHDEIVGKAGAFEQLQENLAHLAKAGARIELRTVLLTTNALQIEELATYVVRRLPFVERWAIMQLENIGFARRRWDSLLFDHADHFAPIAGAVSRAALHDLNVQLYNFPLCTVPPSYRRYAVASISDWKQKFAPACAACNVRQSCSGFFEWHPDCDADRWARPI